MENHGHKSIRGRDDKHTCVVDPGKGPDLKFGSKLPQLADGLKVIIKGFTCASIGHDAIPLAFVFCAVLLKVHRSTCSELYVAELFLIVALARRKPGEPLCYRVKSAVAVGRTRAAFQSSGHHTDGPSLGRAWLQEGPCHSHPW